MNYVQIIYICNAVFIKFIYRIVVTVCLRHQFATKSRMGVVNMPWYIYSWMGFTTTVLLGPVFFRTALPWLSPGKGRIAFHDAVGINWITENQGAGVKYLGKGVYVIWLDITNPYWWRENVMVYYHYYSFIILVPLWQGDKYSENVWTCECRKRRLN